MSILEKYLPSVVVNFFSQGHERSILAKKNIIGSLIARATSILISLLLVPLTINYVNASQYGIWITISSIVSWFSFFDIGLTQGLRNKFAEAKANGDHKLANIYISTTYALLAIICISVWLIFSCIFPFLNWSKITNSASELNYDIAGLALIVFSYFCLQFVFRIITTVLTADQKPAYAYSIDVVGQLLALIIILILRNTTQGSLIYLGFALCFSPLLILIFANFWLFNGIYKEYKPKKSNVQFKHIKSLFNLGLVFFIIQIAGIIQFQTASIIIAQNFNTLEVTAYNIVFKYFGVLSMGFTIFLAPFWSASTEAYMKNDIKWIKNSIKKYAYLNLIFAAIGFVMLFFSKDIYELWLGKNNITINYNLSLWGYFYVLIFMFGSIFCNFLNGVSALRIQFIASIISPFIYIATSFILIRLFKIGPHALYIAAIISNFNAFILAPIQYYKIIHMNKKGIWIR